MICALLPVAKYDRSEHHSLYFMVIERSLISLLVKGTNESLKALLALHSQDIFGGKPIKSLQLISFKQTGFSDSRLSRDLQVQIKLNVKYKDERTGPEWQNIKGCVLSWVDYLKCK